MHVGKFLGWAVPQGGPHVYVSEYLSWIPHLHPSRTKLTNKQEWSFTKGREGWLSTPGFARPASLMGKILTCISRDQTSHKYQTFQRVNSEEGGEGTFFLDKAQEPASQGSPILSYIVFLEAVGHARGCQSFPLTF